MASKKKDTELTQIAKAFLQEAFVEGKDNIKPELAETIRALSDAERTRVAQLAVEISFKNKARYVGALQRQLKEQKPKTESKPSHRRGR